MYYLVCHRLNITILIKSHKSLALRRKVQKYICHSKVHLIGRVPKMYQQQAQVADLGVVGKRDWFWTKMTVWDCSILYSISHWEQKRVYGRGGSGGEKMVSQRVSWLIRYCGSKNSIWAIVLSIIYC